MSRTIAVTYIITVLVCCTMPSYVMHSSSLLCLWVFSRSCLRLTCLMVVFWKKIVEVFRKNKWNQASFKTHFKSCIFLFCFIHFVAYRLVQSLRWPSSVQGVVDAVSDRGISISHQSQACVQQYMICSS